MVYLDDICVFSASLVEHVTHLREVLLVLGEAKLYARKDRCRLAQRSIVFLGHQISSSTITLDPARAMQPPRNRKELQRFLGFCGYYRRLNPQYSALVYPLAELVKTAAGWRWGTERSKLLMVSALSCKIRQSCIHPCSLCHSTSRRTHLMWLWAGF